MSLPDTIRGDRQYLGQVTYTKAPTVPAGSFGDAAIADNAGVQTTKLQHRTLATLSQAAAADASATRQVVAVVNGASGSLVGVVAGASTAATGDATVQVDLLVNGVSVMSAVMSLSSATAAYALVVGAIASTDLVAGDVVELEIKNVAAGTGTLPKGVFARVVIDEKAS